MESEVKIGLWTVSSILLAIALTSLCGWAWGMVGFCLAIFVGCLLAADPRAARRPLSQPPLPPLPPSSPMRWDFYGGPLDGQRWSADTATAYGAFLEVVTQGEYLYRSSQPIEGGEVVNLTYAGKVPPTYAEGKVLIVTADTEDAGDVE